MGRPGREAHGLGDVLSEVSLDGSLNWDDQEAFSVMRHAGDIVWEGSLRMKHKVSVGEHHQNRLID